MSSGEDQRDGIFHPLDMRRRRIQRHLSRDDVGNQARVLLSQFIHDRLESEGMRGVPASEALREPNTPTGPPVEHIREVADCLKRIGDELDQDTRLRTLIQQIPPDASRDTFLSVAMEIFSDGIFNWGRVVALFYFAYKMAVKAIMAGISQVPLIRSIIEWIVHFIMDYVANWIISRGGWEAIQEYFGSTTGQALFVFLAGLTASGLTALYVYWRGSR